MKYKPKQYSNEINSFCKKFRRGFVVVFEKLHKNCVSLDHLELLITLIQMCIIK